MSVLIRNGRVVTAADDYVADLYVEDETVTLIGESLDVTADKVIDASGKYVLPGCVDPHTHLDMPFGGTTTIDDVESGQTSAAFGGTTTHVDFIIQPQGKSFGEAFDEWRAKANGKQVIDMGYHMAVTDLHDGGSLEELATLPDQGITSYKLFMAYKGALMVDDETLFKTMEVASKTGALVMVHAENGDVIDILVKEALAAGHTEPLYHALTRPPEAEGEATNRAIQLAHLAGAPLYVVHVTCKEAVEPIALARERGWDVWGETCTQYFFTSLEDIAKPELRGREVRLLAARPRQVELGRPLERGARRRSLGHLDRPLRIPLGHAEDPRQGRLLEDPERRPRPRGPAEDDSRVRCPRRAHLAQPDGRAAGDEPREALRALPAQGHDRDRLRR
jgi:dihydropyrimidinase